MLLCLLSRNALAEQGRQGDRRVRQHVDARETTLGDYSTYGTYCQYAPYVLRVRSRRTKTINPNLLPLELAQTIHRVRMNLLRL